jgi:hypothetical protein
MDIREDEYMAKEEIEAIVLDILYRNKDAVVLSNQQPVTPPDIGTLVFIVQGQGVTPTISINVGGDVKTTPLPGAPVFNNGELYLLPMIALPTWKVTVENVIILGSIFTSKITSVGGGLAISSGGVAQTVDIQSLPYSVTGNLLGSALTAATANTAQPISSDSTLVDEINLAVPYTNADVILIGSSSLQWIPLIPPTAGLAGITVKLVKAANIYFSASNTTDQLFVWYGGA